MKKLQFPIKNKKLLLVLVVGVILVAAGLFFLRPQNNLSEEEKRLVAETKKTLEAGATEQNVNASTVQEIESTLAADDKDAEAKQQIEELLSNESLSISEKRSAYTALSQVCIPLKDLECADRVIRFQQEDQLLDYYFIVDAARLAKSEDKPEKAKEYYKLVFDTIEQLGGKEYVEDLNLEAQQPLDYSEIKEGSQ